MLYHNTSMYILNHYTMKTFIQCIIFAILTFTSPFLDAQEKIIACPNELQQEWANAEIGVIIHFDMPVFHPDYNWRQFGTILHHLHLILLPLIPINGYTQPKALEPNMQC